MSAGLLTSHTTSSSNTAATIAAATNALTLPASLPGPRNYGPDSPYLWLPEAAADDIPARKTWPAYPTPKVTGDPVQINGASTMVMFPQTQTLRMINRQQFVRPLEEYVQ